MAVADVNVARLEWLYTSVYTGNCSPKVISSKVTFGVSLAYSSLLLRTD